MFYFATYIMEIYGNWWQFFGMVGMKQRFAGFSWEETFEKEGFFLEDILLVSAEDIRWYDTFDIFEVLVFEELGTGDTIFGMELQHFLYDIHQFGITGIHDLFQLEIVFMLVFVKSDT